MWVPLCLAKTKLHSTVRTSYNMVQQGGGSVMFGDALLPQDLDYLPSLNEP
jgi:hypothetical protein